MTKTEYMNTINEKLTAAEGLCADLRKLRGLKKLAQSITGSDALVSFEALGKTIADKEAELKTVRGELQKARRIVKKLDEIEAIEAGTAPAPSRAFSCIPRYSSIFAWIPARAYIKIFR